MVDPLIAFAAIKTASASISAAVKAGRDLSSLAGPITKYAKAEAELQFGAAKKKRSIFAKLGANDESHYENTLGKKRLGVCGKIWGTIYVVRFARAMEELQATIAEERAEEQKQLRLAEHKRQQMVQIVLAILVISTAVAMLVEAGFVFTKQMG